MIYMSGEHINNSEENTQGDFKERVKNVGKKVDINILLNRVREEQKKEKFESVIFIGLIATAIIVTGVIVSF